VLRVDDEKGAAYWTLDTMAEAARGMGIEVGRSQVRRILLAEGVRWRNTRPWAESAFLRSSSQKVEDRRALHRPAARLHGGLRGRARPRQPPVLPSGPGWSPDGHRIKAPLEYSRGPDIRRGCSAR
jgi:hypothetical protein